MHHYSKCFVTAVICVIAVVSGCHKRSVAVAPPPQQITVPIIVRVETPVPVSSPLPTSLPVYVPPPSPGAIEREQADRAFTAGRYDEAIQVYENLLLITPSIDGRDETLFRLGLSYALRNSGDKDWRRAGTVLKDLIKDYPDSSLKPPAVLVLTLRSRADDLSDEVKAREQAMSQLITELERLKQIDAGRGRRLP
jgi:tetratricopeptide (TPR) repeat protein